MLELPNNGRTWITDVSIDPEPWLASMAEPVELDFGDDDPQWPDDECIRRAIHRHHSATDDSWASHGSREVFQCAHDNVYNHENDFGNHFVFAVYGTDDTAARGDWFYADGSAYVATSFGRSSDPRGRYSAVSVWKFHWQPAESGFLGWTIGWWLSVDGEPAPDADRVQCGYSQYPTGELSRVIARYLRDAGAELSDDEVRFGVEDAGEWSDGTYVVQLPNGSELQAIPYCEAEANS